MEKDIFDIIEEKNYDELTQTELAELSEFCTSEEEFLQMKGVLVNVAELKATDVIAPKPEVKQKLDDLFVAQASVVSTQAAAKPIMTVVASERRFYERPIFQVAAMIVVFLSILPFLLRKEIPTNDKQLAKNEVEKSKNTEQSKNEDDTKNDEKSHKADQLNKVEETAMTITKAQTAPKLVTNTREIIALEPAFEAYAEAEMQQPLPFAPRKSEPTIVSKLAKDDLAKVETTNTLVTTGAVTSSEGFVHSDGVFAGTESDKNRFSMVLSEQPEVLDLLTASF